MSKYIVLSLLWSESKKVYIHPGEIYECSDNDAIVLLKKGVIKPAPYKRKPRQVKNKELKDGTNSS